MDSGVAFTFDDEPGKSVNTPTFIGILNGHLVHPYRTGEAAKMVCCRSRNTWSIRKSYDVALGCSLFFSLARSCAAQGA